MLTSKGGFRPYTSLGLVCDGSLTGCAPTSSHQGLSFFLTTPVDGATSLHLYDIHLRLKRISSPLPKAWFPNNLTPRFSHLAAHNYFTFAAISDCIVVFQNLVPKTVWRAHHSPITHLAILSNLLVSIDSDSILITWKLPSTPKDPPSDEGVILSQLVLPPDFCVTCFTHPPTYVNKMLIGAQDGRCLLLNLNTRKIIHIFKPFSAAVTVLQPSPVVDVVAVGTADGSVHLHNFRCDQTIASLKHPLQQSHSADPIRSEVRGISFRSDGVESIVSADASGSLFVWDLNEKRLCTEARSVHPRGVRFVEFLPSQPLLVTTGASDNSIKVHAFDESNDDVRLLRSREGHLLPPTLVRFCGSNGLTMVSTGLDRELRLVSAVQESRNRPFSQTVADSRSRAVKGTLRKKLRVELGDTSSSLKRLLPPVIGIASCNARENDIDFANIVTIHTGLRQAYTWRLENGASHSHILEPPKRPETYQLTFKRHDEQPQKKRKKANIKSNVVSSSSATCIGMSACGNFATVGLTDGTIHCFNVQSGRHLGVLDCTAASETAEKDVDREDTAECLTWGSAHNGPVAALCLNGCGDVVASVGAVDRTMKFWNLQNRKLMGETVQLTERVSQMVWCESSDLLAVATEDFTVVVYDVPTRKIARRFVGHEGAIVDTCFDKHGRRLICASMDGCIRVWDLPSGCCIDTLRCSEPPTSISVGPNGDYLASTHSNILSIRLWVNCSRFGAMGDSDDGSTQLFSGLIGDADTEVDSEVDGEGSEGQIEKDSEEETENLLVPDEMISLSSRPTSVWTVLSHLREVVERNKPVEGAKKGKNAPFFLPTVKGLSFQLGTSRADKSELTENDEDMGGGSDRLLNVVDNEGFMDGQFADMSEFGGLVMRGQFEEAEKLLGTGDAYLVDGALRRLEGSECHQNVLKYFVRALQHGSSFELTQAHLGVFLSCHGSTMANDEDSADLVALVEELVEEQRNRWSNLRDMFNSVTCLSSHFAGQV